MESGIDVVLGVLQAAGFQQLPKPLIVAETAFDFDAAVMGTGVSHDLVVVASGQSEPRRLVRLLSGLSRTLDQVGSRRPVSLVLIGKPSAGLAMADVERHARLLTIESAHPNLDQVRRAVSVLLPLTLPSATTRGKEPLAQVTELLGGSFSHEANAFLEAARVGPDEVRLQLRRFIDDATYSEDEGRET